MTILHGQWTAKHIYNQNKTNYIERPKHGIHVDSLSKQLPNLIPSVCNVVKV